MLALDPLDGESRLTAGVAVRTRPQKPANPLARLTGPIDHMLASVAAAAGLLFLLLTVAVALHPGPLLLDRPFESAVQAQSVGPFDWFNVFVSALGGLVGVAIGAAVIAATFIVKRSATLFVAFSALYSAVYNGVNFVIQRPRPTGLPHVVSHLAGFSYPSGHTAFFVWVGVLVMLFFGRRLPGPALVVGWLVVGVVVLLAGLSRVYVGAHWPSDVVGGLLVGIGWMALSLAIGRLAAPVLKPRAGLRATIRSG